MGLTIYYQLAAPQKWPLPTAGEKLEALRQACLDLPVTEVSGLGEFHAADCEPGRDENEPFHDAKIESLRSVKSPWQPGSRYGQYPGHALVFSVWPARGCEEMHLGLASYPPLVCPKRTPLEDFETYTDVLMDRPAWSLAVTEARNWPAAARLLKQFGKRWQLKRMPLSKEVIHGGEIIDIGKDYMVCVIPSRDQSRDSRSARPWVLVELRDQTEQYLRWRFQGTLDEARRLFSSRKFKADIDRMEWGEEHVAPGETCAWTSSCKTQYANDPREGGMANFLLARYQRLRHPGKGPTTWLPGPRVRRRRLLEETRRKGPGRKRRAVGPVARRALWGGKRCRFRLRFGHVRPARFRAIGGIGPRRTRKAGGEDWGPFAGAKIAQSIL